MSSEPKTHKLFELPLGSRFRYSGRERTYVLLDRGGSGLVAHAPTGPLQDVLQGVFSAAESPEEFRSMEVEFVPVVEVTTVEGAPK